MAIEKYFSKFEQFCGIDGEDMVNLVDLERVKSFINEDYENNLDSMAYEVKSWCSLYNFAKKNTENRYRIKLKTYILLQNIEIFDIQNIEIFHTNNTYAVQYNKLKEHNSRLNSARKKKHYSVIIGKDLIYSLCREISFKNNINFEIIHLKLVELTGWWGAIKQLTSFYNRFIFSVSINALLYHEILHIMRFNKSGKMYIPEEREADNFASFMVTNFYSTLLHPDNKIYSKYTSPETQFKHAAYLVLAGAMMAPHTLKVLHGIQTQNDNYDSSLTRMWSYISVFFNFIKGHKLINAEEAEKILLDCFCAFLCCNNDHAVEHIKLIEKELNINILLSTKP